jgi:hypothetical protein
LLIIAVLGTAGIEICNNALDRHCHCGGTGKSGPPFVPICPKFELETASELWNVVGIDLHELPIKVKLGSTSSVTVESMLVKHFNVCIEFVGQRDGPGGIGNGGAIGEDGRLSRVIDGIVDQGSTLSDGFNVKLRSIILDIHQQEFIRAKVESLTRYQKKDAQEPPLAPSTLKVVRNVPWIMSNRLDWSPAMLMCFPVFCPSTVKPSCCILRSLS